jgi:Bax protein
MIGLSALMIAGLYVLAAFDKAESRKCMLLRPQVEMLPEIEKPKKRTLEDCKAKQTPEKIVEDDIHLIPVASAAELSALFKRKNYDLKSDDEGQVTIPRLYLANLPKDFNTKLHNHSRRELFLRSLLPLVLDANQDIMKERKQLLKLQASLDHGQKLSWEQQRWLKNLAQKYKSASADIRMLLKRVDIIPPSLALAQAIEETGWGTSYAARNKNSTFGITLSSGVKAYENLYTCVRGYILNLNANPAYSDMRKIRYEMRQKGNSLCSLQLMKGLHLYSELRQIYIKKIINIINLYDLKRFDSAQLQTL